ncbi:MAG: 2-oxoglutarate dehydrogenase complex dihydrolipoyllysine-residue succinyltransferase [Endozoicomonadaceae bacterium]|nr:2-oxoglutarate dehydrogenase complex dihydrolipoyllysine-residue succinyltransferase [Endozoicomonadaceae bacterium]
MAIEIKAPAFPESVSEGTLVSWSKKVGEFCQQDELLVEIETDKVVLEIVAPNAGVLEKYIKNDGETVKSQEIIAYFKVGEATETISKAMSKTIEKQVISDTADASNQVILSPAAKKVAAERGIDPSNLSGTGKDGRITKEDVLNHQIADQTRQATISIEIPVGKRIEERVPMTRLRKRIAERLLSAQQESAMLTTFNEVDLSQIIQIRSKYKDIFEKTHDSRLGFMSFFVKACVEALRRYPIVNASIDGGDVVYHGYQDIGVAVSSERGLVVPILRHAELMNLADIETNIRLLGRKAQENKLTLEDMTGGTFTISNGGVFGSMLSTPILNPPQSAILGMHEIKERPIAEKGTVVIRPMMYLALSYDHRLLDGKDAVQFLVTIKSLLEDPARILLSV